jgi:hypothetical protein
LPTCQSKNFAGVRCGKKADDAPYFLFHDTLGRCTKLFPLCLDDSNRILGILMEKELGYDRLIKTLRKKAENLRSTIRSEKSSKNEYREKELKVLYEKVKRFVEIRNIERNKVCRFCQFPLKEPEFDKDQIGKKFSHANFHSNYGYRRADILFHTECAMTWLSNAVHLDEKVMQYVSPKRTGQHTIFSSMN